MPATKTVSVDLWFNVEHDPVRSRAKVQWFYRDRWSPQEECRDQCMTLTMNDLEITFFHAAPSDLDELIDCLQQVRSQIAAGRPKEAPK